MNDTTKSIIEDVIADAELPYSHLSDAPDGDVVVWYDDDTDDDAVTRIVEAVERSGVATYQGEQEYPHDSVTGLVFARRDGLPFEVDTAAEAVITACKEVQGDDVVVPMTAIDEAELPKHLGPEIHQSVWDRARDALVAEVQSRGYSIQ